MGKLRYILIVFLTLIITSCDGLFGVENNVGKPVQFGVVQNPKTRTSYSPNEPGRIDWNNGDKVAIYMDWDKTRNPYKDDWSYRKKGIYEVYGIHENGKESHGSIRYVSGEILKWQGDFSGNDGRANEYPHTFWSVYPSNTTFDGVSFYFKLEDIQNYTDVSGLGLAAYEEGVYSNTNGEGHVELHYYPMFTTLCVMIDNKANFPIGNSLELSSDVYTIAGNYSVDISERYNGIKGGTVNNVSSTFNNGVSTFFIIPREYGANKLYFSLGDKTMSIPETLYPGYKYNIKITTKEVEVEPGFSSFVNGVILAEAHKRRDSGQSGYDWYLDNDGDFAINGQKVPEEKIWEIINSLVDLDVTGTWQITEATADDFNIFPNIKTVKINATNLTYCEISNPNITEISIYTQPHCTIEIHDCESLTKLELKSQNGIEDVTVRNNDMLEFFTIDYPHTELTVRCIDCDKLKGFSVTQHYGIRYHVEQSGCPKWEGFTMPDNSTEF